MNPPYGDLIQCKTAASENTQLSWDAVKDVVTGEAFYRERYPSITFRKLCATNQAFNATAHAHAEKNHVELLDQKKLAALLAEHVITMIDVERFLYAQWEPEAA